MKMDFMTAKITFNQRAILHELRSKFLSTWEYFIRKCKISVCVNINHYPLYKMHFLLLLYPSFQLYFPLSTQVTSKFAVSFITVQYNVTISTNGKFKGKMERSLLM